jgi:hypothetical protein
MDAERWARVQRLDVSSFARHRQRAVHVLPTAALRRPATAATIRPNPPYMVIAPGAYTALVWCEAFSVEFVGATIVI